MQLLSLPNIVSMIRILLTPLFVYLFWQEGYLFMASIAVFTVAALTDWFDGYLARMLGKSSEWGAFLDPLADKTLVWSAFICCAIKGLFPWMVVGIIIARDVLVTTLRILAHTKKSPVKTLVVAKCKTVSQFVLIYGIFIFMLMSKKTTEALSFFIVLQCVAWIVASLTMYTGVVYLVRFYRQKRVK